MSFAFLISGAAGIFVAVAHAIVGEKRILRPLYAENHESGVLEPVATRRVLRAVFHLPTLAWAMTGATTLGFLAIEQSPPAFFAAYASVLYGLSAIGNFWGLQRFHVGNVLLAIAAIGMAIG